MSYVSGSDDRKVDNKVTLMGLSKAYNVSRNITRNQSVVAGNFSSYNTWNGLGSKHRYRAKNVT